jgi:DNA-binding XRE family transcriptional regulator
MNINEKLKMLRKRWGYTQQNISDLLNIPRSTYKSYEEGVSEPNLRLLKKLSDIYQISIDSIFDSSPEDFFESSRLPKTEFQQLFDRLTPRQQELVLERMHGFDDANAERAAEEQARRKKRA